MKILHYFKATSLAKASYDKIWMIDFFLRNLVDYQIVSTNPDSQPDLMLDIVENEVYVIYAVQASITTKCPMDFSSYPFDMCASCHIGCVVIGVKYRNWHRTLMFIYFLLFCLGKGLDHSGAGSDSFGAFLGSQWVRQLKFSAYAPFLILWSLSKFELI